MIRITLGTLVAIALPALAQAQPRVVCRGRCTPPATHFIAELSGGVTTSGNGGLALESVLGYGGKLRGFPPRFYLIGELTHHRSGDRWSSATGPTLHEDRSFTDLGVGLRIYLPIVGPLRLLGDATVGSSHVAATLSREGAPSLSEQGWVPLFALAAGAQLRLFQRASIGARVRFVLTDDQLDGLRGIGDAAPTRITATAGLTWHF